MLTQSLSIARTTLIESLRQPVVLLLLLVCFLCQVISTWNTGYSLGYSTTESAEVTADNKLLFDIGLSTVFVIGALMAGFVATSAISREIENKTILTVISKPIARVSVILGKFLGISGALAIASTIMIVSLLMAVRHGVLSTAADQVDAPVLVFGGLALVVSLGLAAWANFFYGWNFPQIATLLLLPCALVAYVGVLFVGKEWTLQDPHADFKPQVITASLVLLLAILVLASVAVAASTRLGQVMTIVACVGVFLAALLSNYFVGRHVFQNQPFGQIASATLTRTDQSFEADQGDLRVRLRSPLPRPIAPGSPIYFSPSPNGFPPMSVGRYGPLDGLDLDDINDMMGPRALGPAIVALSARDQELVLRNIGPTPLPLVRPPASGDYLFQEPTKVRVVPLILWGIIPNLQFFWLLDAVSQNHPVPFVYLLSAVGYAISQVGVFLSLAVMLFQRRDVG